jgi:hypothetical protein
VGRLFSRPEGTRDEELGLLPGQLTPQLQEQSVQLGQLADSFAEAAAVLESFTWVKVSDTTLRRLTESAGAVLVAEETAAVAAPRPGSARAPEAAPTPAPERLFFSVDGAMVPLVHGQWREVRTLAIGVPEPAASPKALPAERAEQETVCRELSYFSRMESAERFTELAAVEMRRRGIRAAREVAAATDGAEWCQGVITRYRPEAWRILDFPHAGEYVAASGHVLFGTGTSVAEDWIADQLHRLKHEGGTKVIAILRAWEASVTKPEEQALLGKHLTYLEKREAMLQYPSFRAAGWPIASSMVESANKLVVERRLKGPGMHWAEHHVNPMLALRNASCSRRWDAAWQQIVAARLARLRKPPAATARN